MTSGGQKWTTIRYEVVEGGISVLRLDRPSALNALDLALVEEVGALLAELEREDAGLRALVVTGEGRAFAAGADIKEMSGFTAQQAAAFARRGQTLMGRLERLAVPTIAAVNGYALGGGCELAMCCDLILAGERAVFGQPEVKLGVIPGFGGTQRLVRRVGRQRALELMMTGRNVPAAEAVAMGLALAVVGGEVLDAALALARQIAASGPAAVALVKRAVHETDRLDLEAGLAAEASLFGLCFATDDQKEGMAAFREKRSPTFTGR